jgi:hypothetical protein
MKTVPAANPRTSQRRQVASIRSIETDEGVQVRDSMRRGERRSLQLAEFPPRADINVGHRVNVDLGPTARCRSSVTRAQARRGEPAHAPRRVGPVLEASDTAMLRENVLALPPEERAAVDVHELPGDV